MSPADAEREAPLWMTFTRSLARRPPPLYSQEDWEAEALVALAVALRDYEPRPFAPRSHFAPFLRTVVRRHLSDARDAVNRTPGSAFGSPPRATLAEALSMDAPNASPDPEADTLHDIIPGLSADPAQTFTERALRADLRTFGLLLSPAHREAFGFLLRGLEPREVAAITGRTEQAESDRRLRVRRMLRATLRAWGYAC